jgi:hypothetical protein
MNYIIRDSISQKPQEMAVIGNSSAIATWKHYLKNSPALNIEDTRKYTKQIEHLQLKRVN